MCEFHKSILVELKLKDVDEYPVDNEGKVVLPGIGPWIRYEDNTLNNVVCSCSVAALINFIESKKAEYKILDGDVELNEEFESVITHDPTKDGKYKIFVTFKDLSASLGRVQIKHAKFDVDGKLISAYIQDYGVFDCVRCLMREALVFQTDDLEKAKEVRDKLLCDNVEFILKA